MMFYTGTKAPSIQELGNGLLVRPSMQQDKDDLLQLVNTVFSSMLEDVEGATDTYMTHLVRRVMSGEHPSMGPTAFTVVEDTSAAPRTKSYLQVWDLAVTDAVDLQVATPAILRALYTRGVQEREALEQPGALQELRFMLSKLHPVHSILNTIQPQEHTSNFAWYVRVADLPQFLTHIAPVLESRLADVNLGDFDGELKLDFYRDGLSLVFEQGRLLGAETWQRPVQYVRPDAGFPPNVFLQLLFGYRSLAELRHAFPDVWVRDDVAPVLQALFPARPSWILPLW